MTMYFGPSSILLTMNIRFSGSLSRNGIEEVVDRIEAMVRGRYPNIRYIYLEAESLRPSARLADPAYPGGGDLLPIRAERAYERDRTVPETKALPAPVAGAKQLPWIPNQRTGGQAGASGRSRSSSGIIGGMLAAITMKLFLIVLAAIAILAALSLKWSSKTEIAYATD